MPLSPPMSGARRTAHLRWTGEGLAFRGRGGDGPEVIIDGDSREGPAPMEALLLSLAGCMGVDVVAILEKSRVPLESLEVEVEGERRPEPPERYTRIRILFRVEGPKEEHTPRVERAIHLSVEKYCSVFHSLREDIAFETKLERA